MRVGDALEFVGVPERVSEPASEIFVTVRLNGSGAVKRNIGQGKTPVPFTGYRVKSGQFIYSRIDARNGAFAIVPRSLDGAVVSKDFPIFDIQTERAVPSYLMHFFRSGRLEALIRARSRGATNRQRVKEDEFLSFPLELPSLEEQRRIAAILDKADSIRAKRRQVLDHLDALTQSIFRDMFGDPVSNSRGLPTVRLSELGQLDRGVSKHRPRNDPALLGGKYPLIQTGDVSNSGGYIESFTSTYSDVGVAQSKIWPTGTLCITIAANIAKTGILTFDACFPDSVVGFKSDPETIVFIQTWMGFLQAVLEANAPQSAQKNINLKVLRDLEVPLPSRSERGQYFRAAESVLARKRDMKISLEKLDELFASLQSRAFTGEL